MKATKAQDLREKSLDELRNREKELADQLFALRLQKVTGQLEKPSRVRAAKRDLARVLTVMRQKRG